MNNLKFLGYLIRYCCEKIPFFIVFIVKNKSLKAFYLIAHLEPKFHAMRSFVRAKTHSRRFQINFHFLVVQNERALAFSD